jgi:S-formylglutathione hydrolase FrmB
MKRFSAIVAGMFLLCTTIYAFEQKEINVRSEKMNRDIPITVITPESYDTTKTFPVIYLLHGFSDNNTRWASTGVIGPLADQYDIIFVMPDGGYDSWYFDSTFTPEYQYETFVSSELVTYIDSNYRTIKDRAARAITGLSMGGHGAMFLAIRHQDIFGNAGSTSGGVDIRPFPENWNIATRIGSYQEHPENWENNSVINLTHLLKPDSLNIIFDCGSEDFFYEVNCNLHAKLLKEGIPHEFYSRPGSHNWTYWLNSTKYQVLFFSDCFAKALSKE